MSTWLFVFRFAGSMLSSSGRGGNGWQASRSTEHEANKHAPPRRAAIVGVAPAGGRRPTFRLKPRFPHASHLHSHTCGKPVAVATTRVAEVTTCARQAALCIDYFTLLLTKCGCHLMPARPARPQQGSARHTQHPHRRHPWVLVPQPQRRCRLPRLLCECRLNPPPPPIFFWTAGTSPSNAGELPFLS